MVNKSAMIDVSTVNVVVGCSGRLSFCLGCGIMVVSSADLLVFVYWLFYRILDSLVARGTKGRQKAQSERA